MKKEEYFQLPLYIDEYVDNIVWTKKGLRAFDFVKDELSSPDKKLILDVINGKESYYPLTDIHQFTYDDGDIYLLSKKYNKPFKVIEIRGWGYLTGFGGLNLSVEEAKKIQDQFGEYIINRLNRKRDEN